MWLLISLCSVVLVADARLLHQRFRRQSGLLQESYVLPNLSGFSSPFPGRSASSLSPLWPFTGQYNMGLNISPMNKKKLDGFINVPIPGWGIFDFKGGLKHGVSDTSVNFGLLNSPVNPLDISPLAVTALASDPTFRNARAQSSALPVGVLPGNYKPVSCKPPFCNPYVHNIGIGVEVEPGFDPSIDGGLDFPIPLGPFGLGLRFPLSGGIELGDTPILFNYGHKLGPVDPFLGQPKFEGQPRPLLPNTRTIGNRRRPSTGNRSPFPFPRIPTKLRKRREKRSPNLEELLSGQNL